MPCWGRLDCEGARHLRGPLRGLLAAICLDRRRRLRGRDGGSGVRLPRYEGYDIVILVEALDAAFGERFWAFVKEGGYQHSERSSGEREFYRFQKPSDSRFPAMLELFSRAPDAITPAEEAL